MNRPGPAGRTELRALQHDLLGADDGQVLKVVAMVDAMARRGPADELIVPLRPRLAVLRPARPPSFTRMLYEPIAPLIVDPPRWRREMLAVPRSALMPLAGCVRAELGPAAAALDARIAALPSGSGMTHREVAAALHAAAADALGRAGVPPGWQEATGLADADFAPIATMVRAALAHAGPVGRLVRASEGSGQPDKVALEELLAAACADGPIAFATILALLVARLPRAEAVLRAAEDAASHSGDKAVGAAVERAIDSTLDGIETSAAMTQDIARAASELRRIAGLMADIEARSADRPTRKARIAALRRTVDTASRQQFDGALDRQLLDPAARIAAAEEAEVLALEAAARDLRRFEGAARHLGGGDHYDRQLRRASEQLNPRPDDAPATVVDKVRLIEILRGSQAAMDALASAG